MAGGRREVVYPPSTSIDTLVTGMSGSHFQILTRLPLNILCSNPEAFFVWRHSPVLLVVGFLVHWLGGGGLKTSLLVLSLSFQCYSWLELCFAKPPSFSCLTVNNYLAKLLDPGKHQIYAIYSAHASSNLSGN